VSNRIGGVVIEAAKVGVIVWAVLALDPWVAQVFPDLPAGLRYGISAIPQALVLEAILQIAFGWPRIDVHWCEHGETKPLSSLVLRANRRTKAAQSLDVDIQAATTGWIGHQLLRWWMRSGVTLRIRADEAPISPAVERSSKRGNIAAVRPADYSRGFDVELGVVPKRPGAWHWGEVRWSVIDFPNPDADFNLVYELHAPARPVLSWLLRFTWVRLDAKTIRVVRT
jgi:hypothetical protein